ncbi:MAG TPA: bifunctional DNA-formamidopyrimidine glycosylase/DNA-(apurinic or apyrimidinic site) lyase, partial [Tepidisphaeraceae bacterium]|nr:bifunctional DNA-formamidopyrimidine glycosylase/DNA-(apurinic or apyrimidinic site) lyase [Tepidisphaeraceae bacterium]
RVQLHRTDIVSPAGFDLVTHLTNHTIQNIERRGKRIVFTLEDENRFYIHLGMSGRLTVESPAAAVVKHTHLILELTTAKPNGRMQLRFRDPRRFGGVFWLGKDDPGGDMGPEPLSVGADELAAKLKKTNRFIKSALLDQKLIAGLGNIYVDEALHASGIYPKTRADRLKTDQVKKLVTAIKTVLNRALRHRGSTLRDFVDGDGLEGAFQKLHRVYDREKKSCLKCKTPIRRIVLGGRSTHYCPACQPRH